MKARKLSEKVRDLIVNDIKSAAFDVTKRFPGYRALSSRYKVSWGTTIEALNLLEKNNVLHRRPRSGTYLTPAYLANPMKAGAIAFLFPEKDISRDYMDFENWAIDAEIHHGVSVEAKENNARVDFIHMEDTADKFVVGHQMRQLEDYESAVMIGHQLGTLRERLISSGKKVAVVASYRDDLPTDRPCIGLFMPSAMARISRFIKENGYRSVTLINGPSKDTSFARKEKFMTEYLGENAIPIAESFRTATTGASAQELAEKALEIVENGTGELFLCFQTNLLPVFFKTAMSHGRIPGRDFDLLGHASGATFANFYPAISHFKPPYLGFGRAACRAALGMEYQKHFELDFVQGQTTKAR